MIELATTTEIFQRLGIASPTAAQAASADALRLALQERVLAISGFLVTDDPYFSPSQQIDEIVDAQVGTSRILRYRPLLDISTSDPTAAIIMQARARGDRNFSVIRGEIKDRRIGRVLPLGWNSSPTFPPYGGYVAPWYRWQQPIWDVIRITYNVDPLGSATNPIPVSLNRAVVEWVAAIASRPMGGVLQSQSFSAEKISETLSFNMQWKIPPIVTTLLGPYNRGTGTLVF